MSVRSAPPFTSPDVPPDGSPPEVGSAPPKRRPTPGRWWWLLAVVATLTVNWLVSDALLSPAQPRPMPYSTFHQQLVNGNVAAVTLVGSDVTGTFRRGVTVDGAGVTAFTTVVPDLGDTTLMPLLLQHGVTVTGEPLPGPPLWLRLLTGFGPTPLLLGPLLWLGTRAGAGGIAGFGRSTATVYRPRPGRRTTFADVAGIDDVAAEVAEVVDFLRHPDRYRALGATIPRGVLLSGAPGTGKTLLARAVAGEADVPFFSASAAEFVEMIVGVGASRVRDLFAQAKKVAPAIVFIDELDAVGRARGGRVLGGHDEQEQTLNQILTEMDGFTGSRCPPPDRAGRLKILAVHTRSVPLDDDVDLAALAAATPGTVGADLRTLVNEAALRAARRGDHSVHMVDFTDALDRTLLGAARGIVLSPAEKRRTAYHESGHALLGLLVPGADPVRKVTIVPRGHALGVTFSVPEDDRYGYTESYLRGRIVTALGGRAAEELVFGDVSSGVENDLAQATAIARSMVSRWGMSPKLGPVTVTADEPGTPAGASPGTLELVDLEVRRLLEDGYADAIATLHEHRPDLDRLARLLLDQESLDGPAIYAAAGIPTPGALHPAPPGGQDRR
jgi:cell division protease FtsH